MVISAGMDPVKLDWFEVSDKVKLSVDLDQGTDYIVTRHGYSIALTVG